MRRKSTIKSEKEIAIMREGGAILGSILKELENMVDVGVDAWDLELRFRKLAEKNDVEMACMGYVAGNYPPFPTGLCVSINEEAVHCYPEPGLKFEEGDVVTLDTVIRHKEYLVDSAVTVGVGEIEKEDRRLIHTAKMALDAAINQAKVGNKVGDISNAIQTVTEMAGFNVIRGYTGHGIGKTMHETPNIPCWGKKNTGQDIVAGMTLAIEPLICAGDYKINHKSAKDWETFMADGENFVQVEHTILTTENGPEVLTRRN